MNKRKLLHALITVVTIGITAELSFAQLQPESTITLTTPGQAQAVPALQAEILKVRQEASGAVHAQREVRRRTAEAAEERGAAEQAKIDPALREQINAEENSLRSQIAQETRATDRRRTVEDRLRTVQDLETIKAATVQCTAAAAAAGCAAPPGMGQPQKEAPALGGNNFVFTIGFGAISVPQYVLSFRTAPIFLPNAGFQLFDSNSIIGSSPDATIRYEYLFNSGWFMGLLWAVDALDARTQYAVINPSTGVPLNQVNTQFKWLYNIMLEYGFYVGHNTFYVSAGYSGLITILTIRNILLNGFAEGSQMSTLNGGVAMIGYRRYFCTSFFVDLSYSYAIYANGPILNAINPTFPPPPTIIDTAQLQNIKVQKLLVSVGKAINFL